MINPTHNLLFVSCPGPVNLPVGMNLFRHISLDLLKIRCQDGVKPAIILLKGEAHESKWGRSRGARSATQHDSGQERGKVG